MTNGVANSSLHGHSNGASNSMTSVSPMTNGVANQSLPGHSNGASKSMTSMVSSPPSTPNERRLQERVSALERVVEEQRRQIASLTAEVAASRDNAGSQMMMEEMIKRLEEVEASQLMLKRNHDNLEMDLTRKRIL